MKTERMRWMGVLVLFVIVAISYVDRINIAVLIIDPAFLAHMGMARGDRASQGLLATAFMVGYGLSAVVLTPFFFELLGVRKSLVAGLCTWGVVTWLTPQLQNYDALLASRALLGLAEGPLFSLAGAFVKASFASHENGKPNAIVNMGTGVGLGLGFPLVSHALGAYDWETSFHLIGALNLVVGVPLVLLFLHMPPGPASPRGSMGNALGRVRQNVLGALQTRHLLLVTVLTSAFLGFLWGSSNWLPAYLKEVRGFSLREMGWMASLPQYTMVLAVFLGGALIDRLERRQVPLIFVGGSLGVGLCILLAILAPTRELAALGLIAANFFWGLQSPAIPSTAQHYSAPGHTASAFGVVNGVGSLVAGFMPALMGLLIGGQGAGPQSAAEVASGFTLGFSTLIGTQALVLLCGAWLWRCGRASAH